MDRKLISRSRRAGGDMREEVRSSGGTMDPLPVARSSSPPPTPAASSAGASSPAVPVNIGSNDWLGNGQGSKAGSLSCNGSHPPWNSLSTSGGGSNLGSSQPSCRPWERGDLLRRLSTFKPSNWFGKPKVSSSLACARRGWVNVGADKIECESCGARLSFTLSASLTPSKVDDASENFAKQLDTGHKLSCPWRGNSCAESLAQFPPTPPTALVGGYKDRCDGLLQFLSLPVVTASVIDQMRISRGPEVDRFLSQLQSFTTGDLGFKAESIVGAESAREEALCEYSHAQRLISLCGWEPRWLANVQDYEEHSAQSARNGYSFGPTFQPSQDPGPSKHRISASSKKDTGKKKLSLLESQCESRSPLLDCSLCGATVRILDFITLPRPAHFSPGNIEIPETSKKTALTRGVSAASGVNGWVAADGVEKEQTEVRDEAATTDEGKSLSNVGMNLNLTMGGGFPFTQLGIGSFPERLQVADLGRDLMIGQPSGSEVGDRAASYESRGPSTRKRRLEEAGSTVDRPHIRMQWADSIEGTVIDRDGDEVDDSIQYSAGPSKRACDLDIREMYQSSHANRLSGAGPSHYMGFDIDADANRIDALHRVNDYVIGPTSTKDSARASSIVAMDTICHTANEDSMESVENYPGDDDVLSPSLYRNPDMNDTSELNYSNQAQQSACFQPAAERVGGEMGVSNTTDGEEILNTETVTVHARNGFSFGISGGSVGMGASHEAEIHGTDVSVHRPDSVAGDADPIAEVTENQGQSGESPTDPGLMGEFVPGEMEREELHGDSQELMSRSVGRADSSSKIDGSAKAESVESGERISESHILAQETTAHPSLSCNAVVNSGYEASKEEVAGKASLVDECTYPVLEYVGVNEIGPPNGESYYQEAVSFDPIKHHNSFCPWVNGNVAAAGCSSDDSTTIVGGIALCGWQLTLDALDAFQSLGHVPIQTVQSESAASLYKDDHRTPGQKLVARRSVSKGHGRR